MSDLDVAAVGALLLAIGCADLAASGLSGIVTSSRRALFGLLLGLAVGLVAGYASGVGRPPWLAILVTVSVLTGWLFSRVENGWLFNRVKAGLFSQETKNDELAVQTCARLSLIAHCLLLLVTLVLADRWSSSEPSWLHDRLQESEVFGGVETGQFMLLAGLVFYLSATSNAIVRQALNLITSDWTRNAQRLKAGRVIGVIERLFILGFIVAGQATGAGLVVSAKAVLRLPEMTRRIDAEQGGVSVEPFSEYVLVGSMISWLVAFAAGALAARI
ncbi:MAG: hypothetical protein Q8M79_02680 [Dehalococcoidia bacterium]|nr:hypothetical protein [Dehalococcoidia bacterium]